MSEKISGIYIDIDIETAKLLDAATSSDIALGKLEKATNDVTQAMQKADNASNQLGGGINKVAKSVNAATSSMKRGREAIQQLGYQFQDIAIQAQAGTNALVIMAQQGSQILSIFGPMGAIAGMILAIASAMGTALLPSLFDSTNATEDLEKAQKALGEVLTENSDGVYVLSEKLAKLAKENEQATRTKIASSMIEARLAIKSAGVATQEAFEQFDSFFSFLGTNATASVQNAIKELDDYSKTGKDVTKAVLVMGDSYAGTIAQVANLSTVTSEMSEQLGISQSEAIGLLKQLNQLSKNPSPENVDLLSKALYLLSENSKWSNDNLTKLTRTISSNASAALNAESALRILEAALKDLNGATRQSDIALKGGEERLKGIIAATKKYADTIGKTAREKAIYEAQNSGASKESIDNAIKQINANYDVVESEEERIKKRKEAEAAAKRAAKQSEQAQKQIENQLTQLGNQYEIVVLKQQGMNLEAVKMEAVMRLGASATEEQKRAAEKLALGIYAATTAMNNFNSLQAQVSPVFALEQQHQKQLQMIEEYKTLYPQSIAEAEAVRATIEEQYRQKRIEAQWDEWKQSSEAANMFGSAIEALEQSAVSTLTGILNGTMSLRDALSSIANTVLNSVVQSLVEMGMAHVKSMIMGQMAAKAATAAQVAQAAVIASAYAPAASMVSLATQGANAAPAQAGITTTSALAKTLAVTGRKLGGPVSANQMYRVGENNQPEIFKANNGTQYMIPGNAGRVFSNKQSSGGGAQERNVTVVINQTNHFNSSKDDTGSLSEFAKGLTKQIKATVREELTLQMRVGGILAR
ncbi:phage tail length tape measure family protein [Pasteurella multocida]|uniref:phage tail length tape measure family protein n=1 Tax=Pasteurella multocida TaxID=747 RepID=UPI002A547A98|nr:phage tail length tape measure family protein [Pasteurella multocida]MDY0616909.1 phage tail length tape measure family protein [Pasteurella multocida]MDY0650336.1 phage tail length tape measure family protein [Pasteurella multocida]MDY0673244.1 phage tail length tape measure family protein [Pasteurella multocida]MDY0711708.1 phage tail length tape measure family protein [Pasteurella multocida]